MKTLHPGVHGGILARRDKPEHLAELDEHGLGPIDIIVGGLYPFQETVARDGRDAARTRSRRSTSAGRRCCAPRRRTSRTCCPIVDPADYDDVLDALRNGDTPLDWRRKLAVKTFQHVASYDTAIATYLRGDEDPFPDELTLALTKKRRPALRREPAPAGGALPAGRPARARRREGVVNARAAQRQGAVVRQHPRRRRGLVRAPATSTSRRSSSSST